MTVFQHPGSPPQRPELPDGATPPPEPLLPRIGVPAWSPLIVLLIMFACSIVATIAAQVFAELAGWDTERALRSDESTIFLTLVLDASMVAGTLLVVRWLAARRPTAATFGLRLPPLGSALGWTFVAYASFWFMALIAGLLLGSPDDQDLVVDLKAEDSTLIIAAFAVMVCLVAPLAEEFFFRGYLLRVLSERTNVAIGVLFTGFAFGLVHLPSGDWRGMIVLSLFGMALCALFVLTSSLLPCIMLHAFHNSLTFGFTKELPWWGILLLAVGSVMTTFIIARLAIRLWPAPRVLQPSP
jgi:uncharacterized protein